MSATIGAGTCCPCDGVSDCGPGVPLVGSPHAVWQQSIAIVAPAFDFASRQQAISPAL
ncbi:MAG: hypothetical protein ABR577_13665 [Pyrinomonadaceae bacterium]